MVHTGDFISPVPEPKHVKKRALVKPAVVQSLKNFLTFYGTRRFITVSTRAVR
jgi:hypothetical protein